MNQSFLFFARHIAAYLLAILSSFPAFAQIFTASQSGIALPDNGCGSDEVTLTYEVSGVGRLNFDEDKGLIVRFFADHPFAADIQVILESPAGTQVRLIDDNGGADDNFDNTTLVYWDGIGSINDGTAPFSGLFQPIEPLTAFDREVADGTWKMRVCDDEGGDLGTVNFTALVFGTTGFAEGLALNLPFENNFQERSTSSIYGPAAVLTEEGSGGFFTADPYQRSNSAYELTGSSFLSVTDIGALNPTEAFTLAAWVRVDDAISDQKIVGKASTNLSNLSIFALAIQDNAFNFETLIGGIGGNSGKLSGGIAEAGQWYHLAGTWEQNGNKRLYLNGRLIASEAAGSTAFSGVDDRPFIIGAAPFDPAVLRLDGAVDDVRFYNIALSAAGIADIAQPRNSYCQGAIDLPVDGNSCTLSRHGHNFVADTDGTPSFCDNNGFDGGDVWYKVEVPSSGSLTVEGSRIGDNEVEDLVVEVFSGECRSLSAVDCDDDDEDNLTNGSRRMPILALTNRPPGESLYLRFFEFANNEESFFGVCAYDQTATFLAEDVIAEGITLYPNPTEGLATLRYEALPLGSRLRLLDPTGRVVIQQSLQQPSGEVLIDLQQQARGIYFLLIDSEHQRISRQLMLR